MGDAMAITNGKIDGDKFSFDVSFNGDDDQPPVHGGWRLDQDDDEVRLGRFPRDGVDADAGEGDAAGSSGAGSAGGSGNADDAELAGAASNASAGVDAHMTAGLPPHGTRPVVGDPGFGDRCCSSVLSVRSTQQPSTTSLETALLIILSGFAAEC